MTILTANYALWVIHILIGIFILVTLVLGGTLWFMPVMGIPILAISITTVSALVSAWLMIALIRLGLIYKTRSKLKDTENILPSYFKYFFLYHWHIKKKKMKFSVQRGGKHKKKKKKKMI